MYEELRQNIPNQAAPQIIATNCEPFLDDLEDAEVDEKTIFDTLLSQRKKIENFVGVMTKQGPIAQIVRPRKNLKSTFFWDYLKKKFSKKSYEKFSLDVTWPH